MLGWFSSLYNIFIEFGEFIYYLIYTISRVYSTLVPLVVSTAQTFNDVVPLGLRTVWGLCTTVCISVCIYNAVSKIT